MSSTPIHRRGILLVTALCCWFLIGSLPSAEASRYLPNTQMPPWAQPSDDAAVAAGQIPVDRSLPFCSSVDLALLAYDVASGHQYDDHRQPPRSTKFCIYDGPGRHFAAGRLNGPGHGHFFQGLWTDPVTGISSVPGSKILRFCALQSR